ncbi:hypothetical protein NQZ68_015992, partial [Dissostichus eleginoides]
GVPPYQLGVVRCLEVPDDGVEAQVTAGPPAVHGPQNHHLTLDHIHTGLGHLDLGPHTWGGERE